MNVEESTKVSWPNPLRDNDHYVTMRNTSREQWLGPKAYHHRINKRVAFYDRAQPDGLHFTHSSQNKPQCFPFRMDGFAYKSVQFRLQVFVRVSKSQVR